MAYNSFTAPADDISLLGKAFCLILLPPGLCFRELFAPGLFI